jgi:glutamate dehydrogenase
MALERNAALSSPEARGAAKDLLGAAADLVEAGGGPGGFVADLFGRVPPEDLAPYTARALADLALAARAHLAEPRRIGTAAALSVSDRVVERDGRPRELSIIEVINDNRPVLLDSTLAELTEQSLSPRLVAHPIVGVERDASGGLIRVVGETTAETNAVFARESFIHIHLDRLDPGAARTRLVEGLERVYRDVTQATDDHEAMVARLSGIVRAYAETSPPLPGSEIAEARAFLDWLGAGHFTLLGLREHGLAGTEHAAVAGRGLGLLRDPAVAVLRRGGALVDMTPEIRAFLEGPQALIITKASVKSRVHRSAHLDYIACKLFSPEGALVGEVGIVGLFTASAYTLPTRDIPYLREKVAQVAARAGLDPTSHAGRGLLDVLETYPRDDLFQIDGDRLYRFSLAIAHLADRPRLRVLSRPDRFGRFVSLLVYVPKDRYDSDVRARIGAYLAAEYGGRVSAAYPYFPEGPLARTHFIIGLPEADDEVRARARPRRPGSGHRRPGTHLGRRVADGPGRDPRWPRGPHARGPLRGGLLGGLPRELHPACGDRRHRDPGAPEPGAPPRRRHRPARHRPGFADPPQGVFAGGVAVVVRAGACAGKSRLPRDQRADLPDPAT